MYSLLSFSSPSPSLDCREVEASARPVHHHVENGSIWPRMKSAKRQATCLSLSLFFSLSLSLFCSFAPPSFSFYPSLLNPASHALRESTSTLLLPPRAHGSKKCCRWEIDLERGRTLYKHSTALVCQHVISPLVCVVIALCSHYPFNHT